VFVCALIMLVGSHSAFACSACYGKSNDAMAQGMNAGIFSLLAVVIPVLGGIAGFFVYLLRRSSALSAAAVAQPARSETNVAHTLADEHEAAAEHELAAARD